jgi:hypothetical protein
LRACFFVGVVLGLRYELILCIHTHIELFCAVGLRQQNPDVSPAILTQSASVLSDSREEAPASSPSSESDELPKLLDATASTVSGGGKRTNVSTYCLRPRTGCRRTSEHG